MIFFDRNIDLYLVDCVGFSAGQRIREGFFGCRVVGDEQPTDGHDQQMQGDEMECQPQAARIVRIRQLCQKISSPVNT